MKGDRDSDPIPSLREKLQASLREARHLPRTLRMVWSSSKGWTTAWLIILFVQGLFPVASVFVLRALVNQLVAATEAGGDWDSVQKVLYYVIPLGLIFVLMAVFRSLLGWIRAIQAHRVSMHITGVIQEKCIAADMAFYETPDFHDLMHQARNEAAHRPLALLEDIGGIIQYSVTLVGLAAVLIPFGLWLPLVLLIQTLPSFFTLINFAYVNYAWRTKVTPDERRAQYFDSLVTSAAPAQEIRMLRTAGYFRRAYQQLKEQLHLGSMKLKRRQTIAELVAGGIAFTLTAATLLWVVWNTLRGPFSLGDLVLFWQAFANGQQMLRNLMGNAERIFSNLLFIGKLYEFLALEPKVVSAANPKPMPPLKDGIKFETVKFNYPGGDRLALENFDLHVPAGKTAAILGPNGSGKSTALKLLCRFYDPSAGRITIDGVDLREIGLNDLRDSISALFQAPMHYNASARENIALGDLAKKPTQAQIERAAEAAGVHEIVSRLPGGYDSILGKQLDRGTELSGGEWQRIALARAFLRPAPILILDEPTSAMDSWAEIDWIKRFHELARDRTTLIVTHRLSTAMRADLIFVMQRGRVVESGSHQELLSQNGLYATSWASQSKKH